MAVSEAQTDSMIQIASVKIDINQNPVLEADGFLGYIEYRFGITATVDKTDNSCLLCGAYNEVASAQNVITSILEEASKKSEGRKTSQQPEAKDTGIHMVQRSTTDVRSNHFTLSSDCWQYINNTKREELGNIQQECNVKITTKTCVWLLAEPDNLNTEAETKFIDLVSSVGNVKKMPIGRLYDKVQIQKYLPDTNDLVFQEENDLLSVLGPEESLTKLTNLLRDASGIQSFPVVDVSTDVVSNKKQGPDMKECQINILEETMKLSENYRSNISLPGNELVVMPAMDTELEVSDHTEKDEGDVLNMNESPLPESRQMGLPQSEILADHVEETQEESRALGTEPKETLLTGVVEKRPEHEDHDTNVSDRMFCGFTHKKTNQHIVLCVTDITKMKVDVIVSASNECLKFTGGVAKAISEAAGPGLEKETLLIMSKRENLLEVTETVITHGHRLPAKYVIHVVGPRWHKGKEKKAMADLKKSVGNVLKKAGIHKHETIALPAISSGHFGMPNERAAECIVDGLLSDIKASNMTTVYIADLLNEDVLCMMRKRLSSVRDYEEMSSDLLILARGLILRD